jgi:hypothetical protein
MVKDVKQTLPTMTKFRSFILSESLSAPSTVQSQVLADKLSLVSHQEEAVTIHILSGLLWKNSMVNPLKYSSLKLPSVLNHLAIDFSRFFNGHNPLNENISHLPYNGHKDVHMRSFSLSVEESGPSACHLSGLYNPSMEFMNGKVLFYESIRNKYVLEYCKALQVWQFKPFSAVGTNRCIAYCEATYRDRPFPAILTCPSNVWHLLDASGNFKECKGIKISAISYPPVVAEIQPLQNVHSLSTKLTVQQFVDKEVLRAYGRSKALYWCFAHGSITISILSDSGVRVFVEGSEPQIALLLCFNSTVSSTNKRFENPVLSLSQMSQHLNLSASDTKDIIDSFLLHSPPLLQQLIMDESIDEGGIEMFYTLSASLTNGLIGNDCPNKPYRLNDNFTDRSNENNTMDNDNVYRDLNSFYDWRNEMIDACIVRFLKASRRCLRKEKLQQNDNEVENDVNIAGFVSTDELCDSVKTMLSKKFALRSEDIIRRCERLVTENIISKAQDSLNSLSSISYCYHLDYEGSLNVSVSSKSVRPQFDIQEVDGEDLYNHLRIVLGVKSSPNIPKELFIDRFISWMLSGHCSISITAIKWLDSIVIFIIHQLMVFDSQIRALRKQYSHGKSRDCFVDTIQLGNDSDPIFPGIEMLFEWLARSYSSKLVYQSSSAPSTHLPSLSPKPNRSQLQQSHDFCIRNVLNLDIIHIELLSKQSLELMLSSFFGITAENDFITATTFSKKASTKISLLKDFSCDSTIKAMSFEECRSLFAEKDSYRKNDLLMIYSSLRTMTMSFRCQELKRFVSTSFYSHFKSITLQSHNRGKRHAVFACVLCCHRNFS